MQQGIKASPVIGMNISRFRTAQALTQEELSARMQALGCDISRGTLAKIEAGIRHISVEELQTIRTILQMEYSDFFTK